MTIRRFDSNLNSSRQIDSRFDSNGNFRFAGLYVTLNFDLLTPKDDRLIPLPHGPLVSISVKIGLFVFILLCLHVW